MTVRRTLYRSPEGPKLSWRGSNRTFVAEGPSPDASVRFLMTRGEVAGLGLRCLRAAFLDLARDVRFAVEDAYCSLRRR